ncbi:MFS transporter [Marininema halotolerans]|uniref:Predicted arabinose efflux permease, MFS family n=1 Tax=Marininema halotolerans TaxID=1155944 RepID=A0A1I6U3S8_9BACL|nr:MFS transporter [Marininema halotolerans]SFS96072.1 Predicted arabinose efflux permease, MFS family [Marininema halotolerans]
MLIYQLPSLIKSYSMTIQVRLLGEFITCLTGSAIAPFMILYQDQIIKNPTLTMLIIGLQPFADILSTLIGGNITDRFGRKPIMMLALSLQLFAMVGYLLATHLWLIAIANMINGVGRSFYIPASKAQIADIVEPNRLAEVYGLLNVIATMGVVISPFCGLLIIHHPRLFFALSSLGLFIYLLLFRWKVAESIPSTHLLTSNHTKMPQPFHWWQLKNIISYMVLALPISFFYAQIESNFPLILKQSYPKLPSLMVWLATLHGVAVILIQLAVVKKTARYPSRTVILASYFLFGGVALLYGYGSSLFLLFGAQFLLATAETLGLMRLQTTLSQIAPLHHRGRAFSIYGMHWDLSRMIGPLFGSLLIGTKGYPLLFALVALCLFCGGLGQTIFFKKIEATTYHPSDDRKLPLNET